MQAFHAAPQTGVQPFIASLPIPNWVKGPMLQGANSLAPVRRAALGETAWQQAIQRGENPLANSAVVRAMARVGKLGARAISSVPAKEQALIRAMAARVAAGQ